MTADAATEHTPSGATVKVHVPMLFRCRGGRKVVIVPSNQTRETSHRRRASGSLVMALARAHRWQRILESNSFGSMSELAKAEQVDRSYLCKVLRLMLLAPSLIEAILGDEVAELHLQRLLTPFPREWATQRDWFETTDDLGPPSLEY